MTFGIYTFAEFVDTDGVAAASVFVPRADVACFCSVHLPCVLQHRHVVQPGDLGQLFAGVGPFEHVFDQLGVADRADFDLLHFTPPAL